MQFFNYLYLLYLYLLYCCDSVKSRTVVLHFNYTGVVLIYVQIQLYINYYSVSWVVFIYRFHCTSTTTVCPLDGLYIQVPLYINYYSVSLEWSFIYRFHCTSTTTVCLLGGLYIQVPLYINYYNVSLGWSLHTGSTVHQPLQCVPWVVFVYMFHCTSTTTVCPLGGLYIQVPLYINYYNVSLGWSLHTGSTVHQLLQCVPWVVFIYRFTVHQLLQ